MFIVHVHGLAVAKIQQSLGYLLMIPFVQLSTLLVNLNCTKNSRKSNMKQSIVPMGGDRVWEFQGMVRELYDRVSD